jgi:hypothetical protein
MEKILQEKLLSLRIMKPMFLQETEKLYIQPKKVEDIEILSNASKA